MSTRAFTGWPASGNDSTLSRRHLRVDFRPETEFESLIEQKTPRLGWARSVPCPCVGFNDQTDQPDPKCPTCNGLGFSYFRPNPGSYAVDVALVGKLNDEQSAALERANAVVIRGLMTSLETEPDSFRVLGNWVFGTSRLTVRPANKLSYYDRIISLDESMTFSEVVKYDGGATLKTRYGVIAINVLRTQTQQYGEDDVQIVAGAITWKAGKAPVSGTRVAINYLCHPVWVVTNHLHVARTSLAKFRKQPAALQTPEGDAIAMPVQSMVRLEYLELNPKGGGA
jgi:hypothetical protein